MSGERSSRERWLDEQLAEFTDRLLASEPGLQPSAADPELRALQEMVARLKRLLADPQLDPEAIERLQAQILVTWQRQHRETSAADEPRRSFSERLRTWLAPAPSRRSRWALGLSLVAIAALGLLLALFLPADAPLGWLGTATGDEAFWPLAVLAGLLLLVGIIWLWRSRS